MPEQSCVLFASDAHLKAGSPEDAASFFSFLEGPAAEARTLYLLGDIFDLWVGDDEPSPVAEEFARRTAALAAAGVEVRFMAGNHDFLLGEDMAARCGMELLPDEAAVTHWGRKLLLLHGDTLCTDDAPYMEWRAYSRDPANMAKFLAQPLEARQREGRRIMQAGADGRAVAVSKPAVNEAAAVDAARRHGCDLMIHGHTHAPGEHRAAAADGRELVRLVLPAWSKGRGGYARMDGDGVALVLPGTAQDARRV